MRGSGTFTSSRFTRALVAAIVVATVSVLLGACGSSNRASTADPAAVVPASSALYVQLNVPTSTQLGQYKSIVTDFGGASAWTKLSASFNKLFHRDGLKGYQNSVAPWIGGSVGIAFTTFDLTSLEASSVPNGLVFIIPTNNLPAAASFVKQAAKGSGGLTFKSDGSELLVGSASTLKTMTAGSSATLKSSASFQSVESGTRGDSLVVYLNVHSIGSAIFDVVQAEASRFSGGGLDGLDRASGGEVTALKQAFAKLPADATVALGVGSTAKTIRLDVVTHDLSSRSTAGVSGTAGDVSTLPASSILAAALNFSANGASSLMKEIDSAIATEMSSGVGSELGGSRLNPAAVESTINSVVGALGPLKLSISGSSILSIKGGLTMDTPSSAAAARLVALLKGAISSSGSGLISGVTGTAQNFGVSVGPYTLTVGHVGADFTALLGYANASQLTSPGSTLSSNATFQSAQGQMPAGATIPLFFNFEALAPLLKDFDTPGVEKAAAVLSKLSYLAIGHGPGDTRIVVGLK